MTSKKEMSTINKMVQAIEREGTISKVQLVMKSGISISYYDKPKPFMEELYRHKIGYDQDTKIWHVKEQEELEQ